MLEIIKYNEDEYAFPSLLVLGCFDAIHIGHAELLKKAKERWHTIIMSAPYISMEAPFP